MNIQCFLSISKHITLIGKPFRTPKEHNCYSNYDRTKSSGAMESEATAEAFSKSVDKYGLIYRFLIADRDSSVLERIQAQKIYHAYGVKLKKI